jgi:transcriptional regulator with XRE-family HTH domain
MRGQGPQATVLPMPGQERVVDRGTRRGRAMVAEMGRELRDARLARGLSQQSIGSAVGMSPSIVSRVERGEIKGVSVLTLARLMAATGLDLSVRAYPGAEPVRDAAHGRLLERFHACLGSGIRWRTEVPLPDAGDQRAWDGFLDVAGAPYGAEAETRPRDMQALNRRLGLKCRDGKVKGVILILANTRWNRGLLQLHGNDVRANFPIGGRAALQALRQGRDPGGSAIVLL